METASLFGSHWKRRCWQGTLKTFHLSGNNTPPDTSSTALKNILDLNIHGCIVSPTLPHWLVFPYSHNKKTQILFARPDLSVTASPKQSKQYLGCELRLYFQRVPTTACYVGAESVANLVEYVMQLEKNHNCTQMINRILKICQHSAHIL